MDETPKADKTKTEALGVSGYKVFSKKGKRLSKPVRIYSYGGRARDIWVGGYRKRHGGKLPPELYTQERAKVLLDGYNANAVRKRIAENYSLKGLKGSDRAAAKAQKKLMLASFKRKHEALIDQSNAANRQIQRVIAARLRRGGYLRSGWYPALKRFAQIISESPEAQSGFTKRGYGTPAKDGWNPEAVLVNSLSPEGPRGSVAHNDLIKALQRAIDKETASMIAYTQQKLSESVK